MIKENKYSVEYKEHDIYYDLNVDWKNRFHFFLFVNHKSFFLYSSKITYEYWLVHIIKPIDKEMLKSLGYWLKDLKDDNIDVILFYIRVKSAGNEEFLKWWYEYDFKLSKEPLL